MANATTETQYNALTSIFTSLGAEVGEHGIAFPSSLLRTMTDEQLEIIRTINPRLGAMIEELRKKDKEDNQRTLTEHGYKALLTTYLAIIKHNHPRQTRPIIFLRLFEEDETDRDDKKSIVSGRRFEICVYDKPTALFKKLSKWYKEGKLGKMPQFPTIVRDRALSLTRKENMMVFLNHRKGDDYGTLRYCVMERKFIKETIGAMKEKVDEVPPTDMVMNCDVAEGGTLVNSL